MRGKNHEWVDMSGNMPGYTQNFHFHAWVEFSNIKKGSFFKICIYVLPRYTK